MKKIKKTKTPLVQINEFCQKFNLPHLFIKDESKNPFGTWKDRRSRTIIKKARHEIVDKLCLITSGNAGISLANFTKETKLKTISIIDFNLSKRIKKSLTAICYKVIETDLSKNILKSEEIITLARENNAESILDVTNGFHEAYESIIEEVCDENPDYLILPVGSGEGFWGLYNGLQKKKIKTKLIGVAPKARFSFADKLSTLYTPYNIKIKSVLAQEHKIITLNEKEIYTAFMYAKNFIDCEPSSAIVIGSLFKLHFNIQDKIIVINSGKGLI